MKQPKQVRMCIKCRKRLLQQELLRLQSNDNTLRSFSGVGRSFYVCKECLEQPKILHSIIKINKLKPSEAHTESLKEILNLWKK